MTSRQTGQKISQIYGRRTAGRRTPRRRADRKSDGAGQRRLAQFFVCGAIFVALVAVKLLLPEQPGWLSQASGLMERNMDVAEVFSAVGRAFSGGDSGAWDDVYRSVFHPEQTDAPVAAYIPEKGEERARGSAILRSGAGWQAGTAFSALKTSRQSEPSRTEAASSIREVPVPTAEESGQTEATGLAYILYSGENLPENVGMEQVVLGFDYCTPVAGTLSSDFGYREHPAIGEERFHYGLDIAADTGTAIGCFADGTVKAVGESSSYGRYLIVDHENGFSSLYAHCSRITVSSGTAVNRGEKIAEVGETGIATGPHLHFELHEGELYLDPIYYVSLS